MKGKLKYKELLAAYNAAGLPAILGTEQILYKVLLETAWDLRFPRSFTITETELIHKTGKTRGALWRMRQKLIYGDNEKGIKALEHRGLPLVLGLPGNTRLAPLYCMVYEHLFENPDYEEIAKVVSELRTALSGLLAAEAGDCLGRNMRPKTDLSQPKQFLGRNMRPKTPLRPQYEAILSSVVLKSSKNNNNSISNTTGNEAQAPKDVSDAVAVLASPERVEEIRKLLASFEITMDVSDELIGKGIEDKLVRLEWLASYATKNTLKAGWIVKNARNGNMDREMEADLQRIRQNTLNQDATRESEIEADLQRESEMKDIADFKAILESMPAKEREDLEAKATESLIQSGCKPDFILEGLLLAKMREISERQLA